MQKLLANSVRGLLEKKGNNTKSTYQFNCSMRRFSALKLKDFAVSEKIKSDTDSASFSDDLEDEYPPKISPFFWEYKSLLVLM